MMFHLTINGKLAIVKSQTTIKLTRENPLIEDAGDWSLDVVLPLRGCQENLAIFGNAIHRPEPSLTEWIDAKLPFVLTAPSLNIEGNAIVTNITREEVKVQLLAGKSEFKQNLYEEAAAVRLSKMDLGRVLENVTYSGSTSSFHIPATEPRLREIIAAYWAEEETQARNNGVNEGTTDEPLGLIWADPSTYDATFVPVWSKSDEKRINEKILVERYDDARTQVFFHKFISRHVANNVLQYHDTNYFNNYPTSPFAPMPFLSKILIKVFNALGYEVIDSAIQGTWMERIVIANVVATTNIARMLPDWTAKEFIDECRNFFGIEYTVTGKVVEIVRTDVHYTNAPTICIENASDETVAELNKDEEVKGFIKEANVQYYNLPDEAPALSLPKSLFEQAEIEEVYGQGDVPAYSDNAAATLYCSSANNKRIARAWAWLKKNGNGENKVVEVDKMRPHIGHGDVFSEESRDIDIELRIRPCLMEWKSISQVYDVKNPMWGNPQCGSTPHDSEYAKGVPMVATNNSAGDAYSWTINKEINGEDSSDTRPECIEVIYIDSWTGGKFGTNYALKWFDWTGYTNLYLGEGVAILTDDEGFYNNTSFGNSERFKLQPRTVTGNCIGHIIFNKNISVDTRLVRKFTIFDNLEDYDPSAIYQIRGRKYICQKIELTIDENGLNKSKTGYFYELN